MTVNVCTVVKKSIVNSTVHAGLTNHVDVRSSCAISALAFTYTYKGYDEGVETQSKYLMSCHALNDDVFQDGLLSTIPERP
jgi:hypothetical protein